MHERTTAEAPREDAVRDALRAVIDPEIGANIVDLGLVYRIACMPSRVEVDLTMTTPACPAVESIAEDAEAAIRRACAEAREVHVAVVFDPPWTPERMSDTLKERFGW
ncbi:MAG TPA: metal-sulfur cluster assembly factor [Casimicrobiaceae bacterium]|jgi:metal-sulfur cluster biosynthetic enzyme